MEWYHIHEAKRILNIDYSGSFFQKVAGPILRKGIGMNQNFKLKGRKTRLTMQAIRTKGALHRVTIMPIVSAAGVHFKPITFFPGKQAHYRRFRGPVQTLHDLLPQSYLHECETAGMNSSIINDWAKKFLTETLHLRHNHRYILLLLDGYSDHIQFKMLNQLRESRFLVIALPLHTSYVFQPLDVVGSSSYKSTFKRKIHAIERSKKVIDMFNVSIAICTSKFTALLPASIRSGFIKMGFWDYTGTIVNIEPHFSLLSEQNSKFILKNLSQPFRWR